jgi:outer membrane lipoprotein carrier protein
MRIAITALLVSAAATASAPARPAARPPQDAASVAIDKASAAYSRLKSARGTFEQTLTNPLTRNAATSRGEYQLQRASGRWSLVFTSPKGDKIVDDGSALWVYLPSTNPGQVIKLSSQGAAGGASGMDLLDRFLGSPRTRYRVADAGAATVAGRGVRAVSLTPLQPMEFTKATVWIDTANGTLRQFEVTEQSGLVRRFTFTTVRLDAPVDEKALRFTPPKGVKVYDQSRAR